MRTAVSVVLATALVTTPLKLVLAQAAQQQTISGQQTTAPASSSHRPIRFPPITDRTAPLWRPLRTHDNLADALPDGRTMHLAPLSTFAVPVASDEKVVLYVLAGIVIVVLIIVFVLACKKEGGGQRCIPENLVVD